MWSNRRIFKILYFIKIVYPCSSVKIRLTQTSFPFFTIFQATDFLIKGELNCFLVPLLYSMPISYICHNKLKQTFWSSFMESEYHKTFLPSFSKYKLNVVIHYILKYLTWHLEQGTINNENTQIFTNNLTRYIKLPQLSGYNKLAKKYILLRKI